MGIKKIPPHPGQGGAVRSPYFYLPRYWDWQSFSLRTSKAEEVYVYERCAVFFYVDLGCFSLSRKIQVINLNAMTYS